MRAMVTYATLSLVGIMFGLFTPEFARAQSEDEALIQRFRDEYPAAHQKLRSFYANLRMEGRETMRLTPEQEGNPIYDRYEKLLNQVKTWELRGDGSSLCAISSVEGGRRGVAVADPQRSFLLRKEPGADRYTVREMWSAEDPEGFQTAVDFIWRGVPASFAPFGLLGVSVQEHLARESCTLTGAEEVNRSDGEGPLIRIHWEDPNPDSEFQLRGWFLFDPDALWALRAYEYELLGVTVRNRESGEVREGNGAKHGIIEYEGQEDSVPLLRRVWTWSRGTGKSPETVIEVTKLEPGPVPADEFTLETFGIRTDPAPEPVPVMYYLLGLSFACALLVLVFRYLQKRSARASTST